MKDVELKRNAQKALFVSAVIFDSHIDRKWSERYCGTNVRACAHTQELCYHGSYTSETGQGSVWKWVKETRPCNAGDRSREEGKGKGNRAVAQ